MRRSILAMILVLTPCGAVADNDIGCGVGTMIFEGQSGLVPHLAASFTNSATFNSISLTFGLLNCDGRDQVTADAELRRFAGVNLDRLAGDMARGSGETLEALALLYGVADADVEAFAAAVRDHFAELFPTDRTTSGEMLSALDRVLRADEALREYARS